MKKVITLSPSEFTQFADQVRITLVSQLIKGISRKLQTLLKYFYDLAIFAFVILSPLVLSKNFDLDLNDSESAILLSDSSL